MIFARTSYMMVRAFFCLFFAAGGLFAQETLWYFSTKSCPACLRMEQEVLPAPELKPWPIRKFLAPAPNLPLTVRLFPTFVLVNAKGEEEHRLVGAYGKPHFLERLQLPEHARWKHLGQYEEDSLQDFSFRMRYMLALQDRADLNDSLFEALVEGNPLDWAKAPEFKAWVSSFLYPASGPALSRGHPHWEFVMQHEQFWPNRRGDTQHHALRLRFALDLFELLRVQENPDMESLRQLLAPLPERGDWVLSDIDAVVIQYLSVPQKSHVLALLERALFGKERLLELWMHGVKQELNPNFLQISHDGVIKVTIN